MGQAPYGPDLAYIHDAGYGHLARAGAEALLGLLRKAGKSEGLVIDLGCGSGILAEQMAGAGYRVMGVDFSEAMVELARARVPGGEFRAGSFLTAELPACVAVAAVGEGFSYLFDPDNNARALGKLFKRLHAALEPGGLLLFDVVGPGRVPGGSQRLHRVEDDWAVLVTNEEDAPGKRLTRRITTFRKVGELYRRDDEVHEVRVFERAELAGPLRQAGFRVRPLAGYARLRFGRGHLGFLARKP
jgi:SAM-dependent methyltransferase